MPTDAYYPFIERTHQVTIGVAITTDTCRTSRQRHHCAITSAIAMGRMLTAAALTGFIQRRGPVSLQVLGDGHLGQVFADVNEEGHLRGYLKNPTISRSLPSDRDPLDRRSIGSVIGQGRLSVIRMGHGREFHQSTVDLVTGEIDDDVQAYIETSDQVPTAMVCDLWFEGDNIAAAGGLIVQGLPGADPEFVSALKAPMRQDFVRWLKADHKDPAAIVARLLPEAVKAAEPEPLGWQCRCSYEKARGSLQMLGPAELAKMVDDKEPAEVNCDICNEQYSVPPQEIEEVFLSTITARG